MEERSRLAERILDETTIFTGSSGNIARRNLA
jgi:hypothetical protein